MLTIWKTQLLPAGRQTIQVPAGAELLTAREQRDDICVWYHCHSDRPLEDREIAIVGTGHEAVGSGWRYVGSASLQGGAFIFHVFERRP